MKLENKLKQLGFKPNQIDVIASACEDDSKKKISSDARTEITSEFDSSKIPSYVWIVRDWNDTGDTNAEFANSAEELWERLKKYLTLSSFYKYLDPDNLPDYLPYVDANEEIPEFDEWDAILPSDDIEWGILSISDLDPRVQEFVHKTFVKDVESGISQGGSDSPGEYIYYGPTSKAGSSGAFDVYALYELAPAVGINLDNYDDAVQFIKAFNPEPDKFTSIIDNMELSKE